MRIAVEVPPQATLGDGWHQPMNGGSDVNPYRRIRGYDVPADLLRKRH